ESGPFTSSRCPSWHDIGGRRAGAGEKVSGATIWRSALLITGFEVPWERVLTPRDKTSNPVLGPVVTARQTFSTPPDRRVVPVLQPAASAFSAASQPPLLSVRPSI